MIDNAWPVWAAWAAAVAVAFWRRPGASTAAVALVSGWTLLPIMDFAHLDRVARLDQWFDVRGVALPQPIFWTQASVIGLAMLLAVTLFDPGRWRTFQPRRFDLPLLGWCLTPLASGLAAGSPLPHALLDALYLALAWGGPYLLGRLYFADRHGRETFARVLVAAGLAYLPLCLVELVRSPFLYSILYGFHPHEMDGTNRWLGWRPVVFLEHGNALGIWIAAIAVIAWTSWRSGVLDNWPRWLAATAGLALPLLAIASQSVGPIALMLTAVAAIALAPWLRLWMLVIVLCLPVVGYVGFRLVDPVQIRPAVEQVLGEGSVDRLRELPKARSISWRILREEEQMQQVRQRPLLGHAAWDWWRDDAGEHDAPWSLWMLTLGRYGVVGVILLIAVFLVPVLIFLCRRPPPQWHADRETLLAAAFAIVLAMMLADNMLNNTFNLPLLAAAACALGAARR